MDGTDWEGGAGEEERGIRVCMRLHFLLSEEHVLQLLQQVEEGKWKEEEGRNERGRLMGSGLG